MTATQAFATFGLPAIALGWALFMLRASRKSAEQIDARERQAREERAARTA